MRWAGHVAHMGQTEMYTKFFVEETSMKETIRKT